MTHRGQTIPLLIALAVHASCPTLLRLKQKLTKDSGQPCRGSALLARRFHPEWCRDEPQQCAQKHDLLHRFQTRERAAPVKARRNGDQGERDQADGRKEEFHQDEG